MTSHTEIPVANLNPSMQRILATLSLESTRGIESISRSFVSALILLIKRASEDSDDSKGKVEVILNDFAMFGNYLFIQASEDLETGISPSLAINAATALLAPESSMELMPHAAAGVEALTKRFGL